MIGYIFFLHNAFMEGNHTDAVHPEYGKCDYKGILSAFKIGGFSVVSEIRPSGTNVREYARRVVVSVDSLIDKGVPPAHITVIGASKGGYIAMYVSSYLKNKKVNFVFIACCPEDISEVPELSFFGNILAINEKSDQPHSCINLKNKSGAGVTRFKQIELNTGLSHGFQFKALKEWIDPCIDWAKQN